MIRGLLARLDLPQGNFCIKSGGPQHFAKQLFGHKVRAGAGSQISAAGQQLHSPQIDFLIAAQSRIYSLVGFGKSRRIQDNIVIGLPWQ